MLEKPDIADAEIAGSLNREYGLNAARVTFLPLGADRNTAVYRVVTDDADYFVKLRGGGFDEMTILIPKLLYDQGIRQVIAPIPTVSGQLWTPLGDFALTVSPFVEGRDAYEVDLSDDQWVEFGRALKAIHEAELPPIVTDRIRREDFSAEWRERVRRYLRLIEESHFGDPVAAAVAAFLHDRRELVERLVGRAEALGAARPRRSLPFILCHADIHAGNLHIDAGGQVYIVDWDTLILAPKERDLMYPGGGLFGGKRAPQDEESLFYRGYGAAQIDPDALLYYRFERIVEDIAAYCEQLLLTDAGGQDREIGMRQLMSQFQPGAVIDVAFRAE
ncbi:MAG: aminoglycoside phosphotransferase family protein [Anaerolineae bacterium]|nr:aminoglycoside phosphotransferase family protein [Anaerolineae bacterium]